MSFKNVKDETMEARGLKARDLKVCKYMSMGMSMEEIADHLYVSPHTVRDSVRRLYDAFGVNKQTAAVAHALRAGLID